MSMKYEWLTKKKNIKILWQTYNSFGIKYLKMKNE